MNGVDEYIKSFPEEVQERLTVIRNIIRELARRLLKEFA